MSKKAKTTNTRRLAGVCSGAWENHLLPDGDKYDAGAEGPIDLDWGPTIDALDAIDHSQDPDLC